MARLTLTLFGSPQIRLDQATVNLGRNKALALLAYLATTQHPLSRDALVTIFWPDYEVKQGFTYLRQMLWTINKALGKEWLTTTQETIALNITADLVCDVITYRQMVRQAETETRASARLAILIRATELYQGDFLAGFALDDSAEFEQWQLVEANALRHTQATLLAEIVHQLTADQAYAQAITQAQRWLQLDRLHEPAHVQLMKLYSWAGQRSLAVRQYQECSKILRDELGVPPPPEIHELYQAIIHNRLPAPPQRQPPPPIASAAPLPAQPGPEAVLAAPPVAVAVASSPPARHNLPSALTPFIGRETELVQIGARLRDPACRLLTLLGPGGIGKTRLSVAAAELLQEEFADGVYFVALADITAADRLATTIANALQFTLYRREEEPFQQLLNYLADKDLLLVLDNFEHLLDAANLTSALLQRAPRMKILTTSRERLNVQGEWLLEVAGLSYPSAAASAGVDWTAEYSATALFLRSAQRVNPEFQLNEQTAPAVGQICRLVEGMPLALELAATWLRLLSCEEIVAEIQQNLAILSTSQRDLPERHRSMRALFDYSWSLLSFSERAILQQLAVFRGGFRREAAQAVAKANLPVLLALVDKSLVRNDGAGRFSLHELLRQFAGEQLATQSAELAATQHRHMRYFIGFLQQQQTALHGKEQKRVLGEVIADLENVRLAWRQALAEQQVALMTEAVDTLAPVYELRGWLHEGEALFSEALAQCQQLVGIERQVLEGKLLARLGFFSHRLGKYGPAQHYLAQSYALLQNANAPQAVCYTLNNLSEVDRIAGNYAQSEQWLNQSITLARTHQLGLPLARALNTLGILKGAQGDYATAQQLFQECLAIFETQGDPLGTSKTLNNLGILAFFAEDYATAQNFYYGSLTINRDLGHDYDAAIALSNLGLVAIKQGKLAAAVEIFQESLELQRKIGYELGVGLTLNMLGEALLELEQLAEAAVSYREVLHLAQKIHSTPLVLAGVAGMALLAARRGEWAAVVPLAALVQHHPASEQDARNKVEPLLAAAQTQQAITMPPPPADALDQQLHEVVTSLLAAQP